MDRNLQKPTSHIESDFDLLCDSILKSSAELRNSVSNFVSAAERYFDAVKKINNHGKND